MPKSDFIEKLRNLDGTPEVLLNDRELMEILLPMLKSDFEIAETYKYDGEVLLNIPLSVFGGEEDFDITNEDLLKWQEFFQPKANVKKFPGNHFFIDNNKEMVINEVNKLLSVYTNSPMP